MQQVESREQIHAAMRQWRQQGLRTALVPTMGNLHQGHIALVEAARQEADRVVTSIYVNPTQFGAGEDFETYPRTLEADRQALERAGCDLVFVPGHSTMYPAGLENATRLVAAPDLANVLEGASRPGHFDGVVTVVARLFNLVGPDVAVFGEKDYQQLLVIRRMADDLGYGIRIVAVPTFREPGGLAMSSRNNYLQPAQRQSAAALNAALKEAARQVKAGGRDLQMIEQSAAQRLESRGFRVDYVAVRRAQDLGIPQAGDREIRVLAAAWFGKTRLIDNVELICVGISHQ